MMAMESMYTCMYIQYYIKAIHFLKIVHNGEYKDEEKNDIVIILFDVLDAMLHRGHIGI